MKRALLVSLFASVPLLAYAAPFEHFVTDGADHFVLGSYDRIMWSSDIGCPGGEFPSTCRIRAARGDSPTPVHIETLYDNSTGDPAYDIHDGKFIEWGRDFYFAGPTGLIIRREDYPTAPSIVLTTKEDPATSGDFVVTYDHVYWTENVGNSSGKLFRVSREGGPRELLVENPEASLRSLQGGDSWGITYLTNRPAGLCCYSILERVEIDPVDSDVTITQALAQGIDSYVNSGTHAHWLTPLGRGSRTEIQVAHLGSINEHTVEAVLPEGEWRFSKLAFYGVYYFQQVFSTSFGPLYRLETAEGSVPELMTEHVPEL